MAAIPIEYLATTPTVTLVYGGLMIRSDDTTGSVIVNGKVFTIRSIDSFIAASPYQFPSMQKGFWFEHHWFPDKQTMLDGRSEIQSKRSIKSNNPKVIKPTKLNLSSYKPITHRNAQSLKQVNHFKRLKRLHKLT